MNGKINNTLIASLKPSEKPFEVNDTELKGFGLRVQPSGARSFFVRYRLRGKQTRFVLGRTTEVTAAQARDSAKNILAGINLGTDPSTLRKPAPVAKTLGDFIDKDYAPWARANRKSAAATLARIRVNFDEHWTKPLTEITAWLVEKWRTQRLKHPTKPAKPTTVNRDLNALKAAISRAVDWGILEAHPLAKVKPSKVDHMGVVRFLTDEERKRLHAAMDHRESGIRAKRESGNAWRHDRGHPEMPSLQDVTFADHLKPAVVVSLNTGVRQGELFSLCWTDINFEDAQLTVRGDTAKSGRTRHVPLNADAVEALRDWKRQCDPTHALVLPTEAVQVRPRSMAKASAERTYAARALTWFLLAGGHKPMARVVALTVCALLDLDPEDGVDEKQVRDVTEDICKRFKTPRPSRRQSRILGT